MQQQTGALNSETYNEGETGVVTVIDLADLISVETGDTGAVDIMTTKMEAVVAHFVAHTKAIVALQWDHSGSLLLTADKPGHNFHLFRYLTQFVRPIIFGSNFTIRDNTSIFLGLRPTPWAPPSPLSITCTPCTGATPPAASRTWPSPPTAGW